LLHHDEGAGAETDRGSVKQLLLILRRQVSNADKGRGANPRSDRATGRAQQEATPKAARKPPAANAVFTASRRLSGDESHVSLFCIVIPGPYTL
jgi:hypothetical protein